MSRKAVSSQKRVLWISILSAISVCVLIAELFFLTRHPIRITFETEWAIGIYQGNSCFGLSPAPEASNPVIGASDVTDVKAEFVADPFMVRAKDNWYMFFEVMNSLTHQGDIGCAISPDAMHWKYQKVVLDEPFHLSYPYVFQVEDQFYMIPETAEAGAIRLYRADNFPYSWTFVADLIKGSFVDSCIFSKDGIWWMLACSKPHTHDELRLYFADKLLGPWIEHPANPVVQGDPLSAQCGGRILVLNGGLIRFAHEDFPTYGKKVRGYLITEISKTKYIEKEYEGNPVLGARGKGWNRHGMHHIDAHEISPGKWIAVVDGYRKQLVFRMEY